MKINKEEMYYGIIRYIIDYFKEINDNEIAEALTIFLNNVNDLTRRADLKTSLLNLREFADQEDKHWLDCKPSDVKLLLDAYDRLVDED